jgi:hypothetical protein
MTPEKLLSVLANVPYKTLLIRMKEPARLDALFTLLCEGAKDALANPSFHHNVHPELNPNPNAMSGTKPVVSLT